MTKTYQVGLKYKQTHAIIRFIIIIIDLGFSLGLFNQCDSMYNILSQILIFYIKFSTYWWF